MRLLDRYRRSKRRRALIKQRRFQARVESRWYKTMRLQQEAATKGDRRSIGVLLNHLFDSVVDLDTTEPYTNARVAQLTDERLSEDWIEAVRESRGVPISLGDLLNFCEVFDVEGDYWKVPVALEELEPEVRQAREEHHATQRAEREGEILKGQGFFRRDLRSVVSVDAGDGGYWTPEEIEQLTDGRVRAERVRQFVSDRERMLPEHGEMKAIAQEVMGYGSKVWVERYVAPSPRNNLVP